MTHTFAKFGILAWAGAISFTSPAAAQIQEEDIGASISVELNTVTQTEAGCSLAFLAINGQEISISRVVYEMAIFDAEGQFAKLALFDFGALPAARPRVRQFVVDGVSCDRISRVLINGASTCEADDLGGAACVDALEFRSRTDIEVIG